MFIFGAVVVLGCLVQFIREGQKGKMDLGSIVCAIYALATMVR